MIRLTFRKNAGGGYAVTQTFVPRRRNGCPAWRGRFLGAVYRSTERPWRWYGYADFPKVRYVGVSPSRNAAALTLHRDFCAKLRKQKARGR